MRIRSAIRGVRSLLTETPPGWSDNLSPIGELSAAWGEVTGHLREELAGLSSPATVESLMAESLSDLFLERGQTEMSEAVLKMTTDKRDMEAPHAFAMARIAETLRLEAEVTNVTLLLLSGTRPGRSNSLTRILWTYLRRPAETMERSLARILWTQLRRPVETMEHSLPWFLWTHLHRPAEIMDPIETARCQLVEALRKVSKDDVERAVNQALVI